MFPTGAKLINWMREKLVRLTRRVGIELRQSYSPVDKPALIKHQRYAHAKQFKRAGKALRMLKTYLGPTIRNIGRQIAGEDDLKATLLRPLHMADRVLEQNRHSRGRKVYSLHAPRKWGASARQGAPSLRVWCQGVDRHHAQALEGRSVCAALQGAARQSL